MRLPTDVPSDLPPDLPPDLPHEVAERVRQPGFDAVLDRARTGRRRRRTTVASGLAAVVVVGGLATWGPSLRTGDSPDPAGPSRTGTPTRPSGAVDERLPVDVRQVLAGDMVEPWVVSGSGGATAAVWADCRGAGGCRHALVTRLGDRVHGRLLPEGTRPVVQPVPGGWLLEGDDGFLQVTPEGGEVPVLEGGGDSHDVQAGDTAVETTRGWRLLRGDTLVDVPVPEGEPVRSAYVTPAGRLVVAVERGSGIVVAATDEGVDWDFTHMTRTDQRVAGAVLAGHGDDVAAVLLGDDPDGSIPVLQVSVSGDAGQTWHTTSGPVLTSSGPEGPDGLADLNGIAVTDDGTTFLTAGTAGLVRVDPSATVVATPLSSHDRSVFLVAHRVCLVVEHSPYDELSCSADDGTTWVPQALPGLR